MDGRMKKAEVKERIAAAGVIPVIRAGSTAEAMQAAEAVAAGGIPVVEITMTVPGALEAIAALRRQMGPQVAVGAGTVLDAEAARRCLAAGAEFLVSPGLDLATIAAARQAACLMLAGALTPSEILAAWRAGSDLVKVFPCGSMGGPGYIKALRGPLPQIPLVPTGGVNLDNVAAYRAAGAVAVGVGGELIPAAALRAGRSEEITALARQFRAAWGPPVEPEV
jgi:2-dehydro-3-deoxyphosphogluconate aldolase/(4S)-4-hydroxy-2-oxoglutarate aldolase